MTDSEVLWLLCDFVWMADVWVVNYSMILKRLIFDPVFNQYISIYVHIYIKTDKIALHDPFVLRFISVSGEDSSAIARSMIFKFKT